MENLDKQIFEHEKKLYILKEQYRNFDCDKLKKQLQDIKLQKHKLKYMTMKLQLAATMEEEKNMSNEVKQKILKESFDEYTNKAKECSSRLKTDIIEKRGKEKLSEINKENADLKLKLQAATDSKDNMNLKLCQMESNHTILQNRNAAILIRLRKSLHDAECERRAIKDKLYSLKLSK